VNGPTDGGKDEDRPHYEVKKRIKSGMVCQGLRLLFGHDEGLLRRTGKCSRRQAFIRGFAVLITLKPAPFFRRFELRTGKSRNGILCAAKRIEGKHESYPG
jgi:hypothetical protein